MQYRFPRCNATPRCCVACGRVCRLPVLPAPCCLNCWPDLAAGLPKLKIEECAARQQAHIDSNKQARCLSGPCFAWGCQLTCCLIQLSIPRLLCPALARPALQVIVGVNKYAQHEEEGDSGGGDGSQDRELDVRKIDNTAVLRTQKERLQVRGATASGAPKLCQCYLWAQQPACTRPLHLLPASKLNCSYGGYCLPCPARSA